MIDNFEAVKELINFNEANNMFLYLRIIKYNIEDSKYGSIGEEELISSQLIRSRDELDKAKDTVKLICDHCKADAWISIGGLDLDKLQRCMLKDLCVATCESFVVDPSKLIDNNASILVSRSGYYSIYLEEDYADRLMVEKIKEEIANDQALYRRELRPSMTSIKLVKDIDIYEFPMIGGLILVTKDVDPDLVNRRFPELFVDRHCQVMLYSSNDEVSRMNK